jgi:DNA polymerase I-like protein with 3'-5' exonuclease and polymerase domains
VDARRAHQRAPAAYLTRPGQRGFDLADLALRYLRRELRADGEAEAAAAHGHTPRPRSCAARARRGAGAPGMGAAGMLSVPLEVSVGCGRSCDDAAQ